VFVKVGLMWIPLKNLDKWKKKTKLVLQPMLIFLSPYEAGTTTYKAIKKMT